MDAGRKVLIVDDESGIRDMLARVLVSRGYTCHTAEDGLSALARIGQEQHGVVLADIRMPRMGGLELLKEIKSRWPAIEVVILTGVFEVRSAIEAMRNGAYDYVTKPFAIEDIAFAVDRAFHKRDLETQNRHYQQNLEAEVELRTLELLESNQQLQQLFVAMLKTLANTLEAKDRYTHGHSERVAAHAVSIGRRLAFSDTELSQTELAGLLHDIGKIGIREEVLHKPDALTDAEFEHIKTHPEIGELILRNVQ
jgi:putative two-component system response regulator